MENNNFCFYAISPIIRIGWVFCLFFFLATRMYLSIICEILNAVKHVGAQDTLVYCLFEGDASKAGPALPDVPPWCLRISARRRGPVFIC